MAHNTKSILVDVNGKPIPQYFDPLADEYKPLLGQHGAARSILYGPDGNPISDTNKLPVRAADLETLIGTLNDSAVTNPANAASVIAALKGLLSVVGKEATLGQILLALGSLATESTLASLASSVAKEATLSGVKSAVDTLAGTVSDGAAKVTLTGQTVEYTMANQVEIRDTNSYDFTIPPEVIGDWVDFELYITDTHLLPDSDRTRPKMFFAIGGSGASSNNHITVMGKTRSYAWRTHYNSTGVAGMYIRTYRSERTNRAIPGAQPYLMPVFGSLIPACEFELLQVGSGTVDPSDLEITRYDLARVAKEAFRYRRTFTIRYETSPGSGSVSIVAVGRLK